MGSLRLRSHVDGHGGIGIEQAEGIESRHGKSYESSIQLSLRENGRKKQYATADWSFKAMYLQSYVPSELSTSRLSLNIYVYIFLSKKERHDLALHVYDPLTAPVLCYDRFAARNTSIYSIGGDTY